MGISLCLGDCPSLLAIVTIVEADLVPSRRYPLIRGMWYPSGPTVYESHEGFAQSRIEDSSNSLLMVSLLLHLVLHPFRSCTLTFFPTFSNIITLF